ncbi:MAG TPA: hypothetical protein O0X27_03110 [Methanocorpusculum sp.]|nr:hypothetical protein [Methanocorpusculum sp.]
MKKVVSIGTLALVVIGCVIAAGCTSKTSDNQIIGAWVDDDGKALFVLAENLTGAYYTAENGTVSDAVAVAWKKNADGTYSLIKGTTTETVTVNPVKGTFFTTSGTVFTKHVADASGAAPLMASDKSASAELGFYRVILNS